VPRHREVDRDGVVFLDAERRGEDVHGRADFTQELGAADAAPLARLLRR
jgi:hypothetical protein